MNKYVEMWKRYYNKLMGEVTFTHEKKSRVPRHVVKARRAANYRARASRRINRLMAKGKHI